MVASLWNIYVLSFFMLPHYRCFSCHQFHFQILSCLQVFSAFHVQAHHSHSPMPLDVGGGEHVPSFCFMLFSFFSYLLYLYAFNSTVLSSFLSSGFCSFHQSQSLDQVTLTNATILDGSGGGPNGSLAGSMGSVAVCLPSESSLTDSLHTSAVSGIQKHKQDTYMKYVFCEPFPCYVTAFCSDDNIMAHCQRLQVVLSPQLSAVWLVVLKYSHLSMLHCMFCLASNYYNP